jgi:UDPglucose 6-dehydrogenase
MNDVVGIIGHGFVGQSISFGFSPTNPIKIYDNSSERSLNSIEEVVVESDFIFVSVPTPMNEDGSQNLDAIYDVMSRISREKKRYINAKDSVVIIKSTVIPGTVDELQNKYSNLNLVFNPEFLTERTSKLDFLNQARIILGGDEINTEKVAKLYRNRFKHNNIMFMDFKTAEFVKYFCNVFFSVKISFMNEMKLLSEKLNVDWEKAVSGFAADNRVSDSHLDVPGPDGKLGFGGSCFPKDLNALVTMAEENGIDMKTVKAAWETNVKVRNI